MKEVIEESRLINEHIKETEEYRNYIDAKQILYSHPELYDKLKEFRNRNYELQRRMGTNPYDEVGALTREYGDLLCNSIVNDFLRAEQRICRMMQEVYESIAEGLEFDYPDE